VRTKLVTTRTRSCACAPPRSPSAKQFNGLMKWGLLAHDALVKILMPPRHPGRRPTP